MPLRTRFELDSSTIIVVFVLAKLLLHLYTNAFEGYGVFRDELYLYACSLRPDIGYVDQPPLSVWVLGGYTSLFGKSLFVMRLVPALLGAAAIIPLAASVRLLGGSKVALVISLSAYIISPIYLAFCGYYSMNSIDLLLWNTIIYLIIKLTKSRQRRIWIYLGFCMGLALMNKIGMLWFGMGFLISLVLTKERRWLKTLWPYLAGAIAFLLFSPYIIWNALNAWPTIEFLGSTASKYQTQNISTFLSGQLLINNPANLIVWVPGLLYLLFSKTTVTRQLLFIFLTILSVLLVNGHSKPEYLSPIFFVLFIGGGLAIEQWTQNKRWIAHLIIANQWVGILAAPLAIPILPVEKYIAFAQMLGMAPSTAEGHELSALPQFYADMFGWENQVRAVASVYHGLSEAEKARCVIFGDNYGRAGAIDYFSETYDLPLSIGNHNNYWIWGPRAGSWDLLIILSDEVGSKSDIFEEVIEMGTVSSKYAIPYENNLKVYLCKYPKVSIADLWPELKSYN
jgi:hypothetical protein